MLNSLKENNTLDLYNKIELPLSTVLAKMELNGIRVDKSVLEEMALEVDSNKRARREISSREVAIPRLNFAISTYYKGTGLEEVLKKLEEYLDNADKKESDITNI